MIAFHRFLSQRSKAVTLFVVIWLMSCNKSNEAEPSAARPTTPTSTQPAIKAIDMHSGVYPARLDIHTTITPDGLLRSVRTENKNYSPIDAGPEREIIEMREGRLTEAEIADLARLFTNWDALSSEPHGGVADGPEISLRYGAKTVSGGSGIPQQVLEVESRINELAASMPVVKP